MHEEALDVLPALLDGFGIENPLLVGHSDGASIALIHAAQSGRPVAGLVLMAPHVFVEDICIEASRAVRATYESGGAEAAPGEISRARRRCVSRLGRYLAAAGVSRLVNRVPAAGRLTAPALLIQGEDDEYGTLEHIDRIAARSQGPTQRLVLAGCGHSPQRDHEAAVRDAIVAFARSLPSPQ